MIKIILIIVLLSLSVIALPENVRDRLPDNVRERHQIMLNAVDNVEIIDNTTFTGYSKHKCFYIFNIRLKQQYNIIKNNDIYDIETVPKWNRYICKGMDFSAR